MKTKILLLIANILIFAMPLLAIPPESDTVWTKSLFPCEIKGSSFSLTGDSIIALAGAGTTDTLFILETATGNILKKSKIKPGTFSYNGFKHFNTKSWIAICLNPEYGGMYIYNYIDDKILKDDFGVFGHAIAITSDDKKIYVQNNRSAPNNISVFDVEKNEFIDSISSGFGVAHSLAISPDDKCLAIATGMNLMVYPDPEEPPEERMFDKIVIINRETKEIVKEFDGFEGTQGKINDMKFSLNSKYLGVVKLDGTLRVLNIETLELYRNFTVCDYSDYLGPWTLSFSKDIKYILTGLFALDYSTKVFDIEGNFLIKTIKVPSYTGIDASTKDSILVSSSGQITLLMPNILTDVKENLEIIQDTININIMKSKSSTFQFKYNEIIKKQELYDYNGNILNKKNILNINNETLLINAEYLPTGVYFLVINDNTKPIKILVTE